MLQIEDKALKVINLLNNAKYEAFLVGGCLRDILLGKSPHDIDITTNALPNQIKEVFKDYKTIDISGKCGTIILYFEHHEYEITTYRLESNYIDHRHPSKVCFSNNLNDDLSRRDFTINALAYHPKTGLIDLFHGQNDLNNKVIRCIGDPNKRFQEDALRILRALRFSTKLNFTIEENTKKEIHNNKELLKYISIERIMQEFKEIIISNTAAQILMEYQDVIAIFLPEIKIMFHYQQNCPYHMFDLYQHSIISLSKTKPLFYLRLAALFHDIGKPYSCIQLENGESSYPNHAEKSYEITTNILTRLHLDKETVQKTLTIIRYHHFSSYLEDISNIKIKKMIILLGYDLFMDLLNFQDADAQSTHPDYYYPKSYYENIRQRCKDIYQSMDVFSIKDLKIKGDDLIQKGYQGKQIKEKLEELFQQVIEEKLPNDLEVLLKQI